jgi:hypothetical protein
MNWSQLGAVLWLRWRLTRNQIARAGAFGNFLMILAGIGGVALAIGAGVGGVMGGAFGLAKASPQLTLIVWDVIVGAFLFIWLLGVIAEVARSEAIDLTRLLHLPVSLEGIFVVNYFASLLTVSVIVFLPGMLGLCIGLLFRKGFAVLLLIPLALSFLFMVTAWAYYLRGWLISMMVNPRRRRQVLVGVSLAAVLLGQLPNLYLNVYLGLGRHGSHPPGRDAKAHSKTSLSEFISPNVVLVHECVPLLWLPDGAMCLTEGNPWPAVFGTIGGLLVGVAGLAGAYRSTLRFYQGYEKSTASKRPVFIPWTVATKPGLLERRLPLVNEEASALALATFRSLSRAPELKMSLVGIIAMMVVFPMMLLPQMKRAPDTVAQLFIVTGAVAVVFFSLSQILFNQFGFDRDGFRALVLLPVRRRDVLLAKNLAMAPIAFGLGITMVIVVTVILHLPLLTTLAACFQLGSMFLLMCMLGNLLSVIASYRIGAGSLKPTKASPKIIAWMFLGYLLFSLLTLPIFIPPLLGLAANLFGSVPAPLADALAALVVLVGSSFAYRASLTALGDLLERREQGILLVVSHEIE